MGGAGETILLACLPLGRQTLLGAHRYFSSFSSSFTCRLLLRSEIWKTTVRCQFIKQNKYLAYQRVSLFALSTFELSVVQYKNLRYLVSGFYKYVRRVTSCPPRHIYTVPQIALNNAAPKWRGKKRRPRPSTASFEGTAKKAPEAPDFLS